MNWNHLDYGRTGQSESHFDHPRGVDGSGENAQMGIASSQQWKNPRRPAVKP